MQREAPQENSSSFSPPVDVILKKYAAGERNFREIDLSQCDLRSINLKGADLSYADLSEAILNNANLRGTDLSYANLSSANLTQADLRGTSLFGVDLRDAILKEVRLAGADYDETTRFPAGFDPVKQIDS